jgi:undecaprenyl-diphosphatase
MAVSDRGFAPGRDRPRRCSTSPPPPGDAPRRPWPAAALASADHRILAALRAYGTHPWPGRAAHTLSWCGEHAALWLAAGLAAAATDPARRTAWLRATALTATAHLTSMAVKRLVRRPRPAHPPHLAPLVRTAGRHSFPSSHAASSVAAAVACGALKCTGGTAHAVRATAAAICASRLLVGVHYPSDVAAGAALGALVARLGTPWLTAPAPRPRPHA